MRRAVVGLVLALAPLACGSEQSEMDRGLVTDREEAVPSSGAELQETEAERRKQQERQLERKTQAAFERADEEASP